MKFSCVTQELLTAVQLVSRAIGSDQTLPILQNILMVVEGKRCTLSATNLELSIITSFEVSIENEGGITIPAKAILNFLQYCSDPQVALETSEGTQLKIHSKHAKAVIAGDATNGFPTIPNIQRTTTITLVMKEFLHALNLVTFACAKTTTRPVISGVYTYTSKGKLILVGTDSYRLSEVKINFEGQGEIGCIIPSRFLEEVRAIAVPKKATTDEKATLEISMSNQQVEARVGSTILTSRLIDGKFPDYLQVLPKEKVTTLSVGTDDLLSTLKRMHYFAKEVNNNITFQAGKQFLHLHTKQTQLGKDEADLDIELTGEENKIALSSSYLIDFLSRIDSEKVLIELSDKLHPAVFRLKGEDGFLHLVMPLRMAEE